MKKIGFVLLAVALVFGMTQCKKDNNTPTSDGGTIFMTLEASCGGGRTVFDPNVPGIKWGTNSDEYINVGSSVKGYLGMLHGKGDGNNAATSRLSFSGVITSPDGSEGEKLYFFYLGNGSHPGATSLDFSNQETSAGAHYVTNYVIAIGEGTVTNSGGYTYTATADLEIKTAIAYFNVSNLGTSGNVSLHGNDVYSTVTINYRTGTITGDTKGSINIGSASEANKYVALIPSVSIETTLVFDSDTKSGGMTFPRGIQENRYYSNEGAALVITGEEACFTVNDSGKKVRFSPGNLQAVFTDEYSYKWQFAPTQNSYIGNATANTAVDDNRVTTAGTVDLFGWVGEYSVLNAYGINNSQYNGNYGYTSGEALKNDWGEAANEVNHGHGLGGYNDWRTLTKDEWVYLFNNRTTTSKVRYAKAKVNNVNGVILLPDNWSTGYHSLNATNTANADYTTNDITLSDWSSNFEAHGAVFLPAAGYRDGTSVNDDGSHGYYWSSTSHESTEYYAYSVLFFSSHMNPQDGTQMHYGGSVRLVRNIN